jgi:hypothetical protein
MKPLFNNTECVPCVNQETEILSLLFHEIKNNKNFPSANLNHIIEALPRDHRKELTRKEKDGVCPLFCAALSGNSMAVEYLVTNCNADLGKFLLSTGSFCWKHPVKCLKC